MQRKISLQMLPSEAANDATLRHLLASACATTDDQISGYTILKKSIDARGRQIKINITANVFIDEPFRQEGLIPLQLQDVHHAAQKTIIVGAGPAGLFAAIRLIEAGIKPIILERGKNVRARRR